MNNPLYLIVGFGVTWAALLWFAWRVERRIRAATSELAALGGDVRRGPES